MSDIDWKKINEDIQYSLIKAKNELIQEQSTLRSTMQKFQQDRSTKLLEQQQLHEAIIHERLCEEKIQEAKPIKKKIAQKKKTVYI